MSFKTSKVCGILAGQAAWLAVTFLLFGQLGGSAQGTPWIAVVAMFFLLPLTLLLWFALTLIGAVAGRTQWRPIPFYPLGAGLAVPAALAVFALIAKTLTPFTAALDAVMTGKEMITFICATAVPGLVAGGFMALFGAPAPVTPHKPSPVIVTQTWARVTSLLTQVKPPEKIAFLVAPTSRADAAQFRGGASMLVVALAALLVLNFLRIVGGPIASLADTILSLGQWVFLWAMVCLFANRFRDLGQNPLWALAPGVLAAVFVFTGPPDAAAWQAPLSVLLVYAIAGAVLYTFKSAPGGEAPGAAPARNFGLRAPQPRS